MESRSSRLEVMLGPCALDIIQLDNCSPIYRHLEVGGWRG